MDTTTTRYFTALSQASFSRVAIPRPPDQEANRFTMVGLSMNLVKRVAYGPRRNGRERMLGRKVWDSRTSFIAG
jgi:hypothetical protein